MKKTVFFLSIGVLLIVGAVFIYKHFFAPQKLSIAIITDIDHCPSREAMNEGNLEKFLQMSKERKVDFQVSLGDNASHRLRNCSDTGDKDAKYVVEKIRSNGVPTYLVLGDHDIASSVESSQNWLQTLGREKAYYSFDSKDVHIVVLDTVLGGDAMSPPCEEVESCKSAQEKFASLKEMKGSIEYKNAKDTLEQEEARIKLTRSDGVRDAGRVGEEQLRWLEEDINSTEQEKILILSDHPLFPFASSKKSYQTVNAEKVREIIKKSGKQAVFIGGEAHLWHEETFEGFPFYIVDEFRKANGSWAIFEWDKDGFRLERITH